MFSLNVLKRNAQGTKDASRKFPRSNIQFENTPTVDSHSASETRPPFLCFDHIHGFSARNKSQSVENNFKLC